MPLLARAKRRNGNAMGSATVLADSNQTKLCAYLSAILLAGLILNATAGWWWADPIAALAIAALAINEGREAWRGRRPGRGRRRQLRTGSVLRVTAGDGAAARAPKPEFSTITATAIVGRSRSISASKDFITGCATW